MQLMVLPAGEVRCLYGEAMALAELGPLSIRRASSVEPDMLGRWTADLTPVAGPVLGPYATRGQALAAEEAWLLANWLVANGLVAD